VILLLDHIAARETVQVLFREGRMKMKTTITRKKIVAVTLAAFFVTGISCELSWMPSSKAQTPRGINVAMGDGSVRFLPNHLIGFVVGQELRIILGLPPDSTSYQVTFQCTLHGQDGHVLFESEAITVPRGQFRFLRVSRTQVPTVGDAGTGRAQVLLKLTVTNERGVSPADSFGAVEIIDEATGESRVRPYSRFLLHQHFPDILDMSAGERLSTRKERL
jgi:hypothetical protein